MPRMLVHGIEEVLEVWQTGSGKLIQTIDLPYDQDRTNWAAYRESLAWAPDGRSFTVVSEGKVYLRELANGQIRLALDKLGAVVHTVAYSPDGRLLVVALA